MLAFDPRMHSIHKLFGNRVRQLREEQQLGAADVAALIGCDVSHYYSIERGAHPPSFALIVAIAKTFKVDEADLFTWPGAGLRHDLREQVRLATPPVLSALKVSLAEGTPEAAPKPSPSGSGSTARSPARRRSRR
jgi:transcriptional regulator with XRE-family HTH domain